MAWAVSIRGGGLCEFGGSVGEGDMGRGEELDGLGSVRLGEADWCEEGP